METHILTLDSLMRSNALLDYSVQFGGIVRNLRKAAGSSQEQLARAIKVPRPYLSRIENGKIIPSTYRQLTIATALGMTLSMFTQRTWDKVIYQSLA